MAVSGMANKSSFLMKISRGKRDKRKEIPSSVAMAMAETRKSGNRWSRQERCIIIADDPAVAAVPVTKIT